MNILSHSFYSLPLNLSSNINFGPSSKLIKDIFWLYYIYICRVAKKLEKTSWKEKASTPIPIATKVLDEDQNQVAPSSSSNQSISISINQSISLSLSLSLSLKFLKIKIGFNFNCSFSNSFLSYRGKLQITLLKLGDV